MAVVDTHELETKVKDMYRGVAQQPYGVYHFEMGRPLAERLGYAAEVLDRIPAGAVESFAGVGFFFDLAALRTGERVLDLGSGAGTDVFYAAHLVGPSGHVVGVDFTPSSSTRRAGSPPSGVSRTWSSARGASRARRWRQTASTARSPMV